MPCVTEMAKKISTIDVSSPLSKTISEAGSHYNPWLWTGAPFGALQKAGDDAINRSACSNSPAKVYRSLETHTALGVLGQVLGYIIPRTATEPESIMDRSPTAIDYRQNGAPVEKTIDPFRLICPGCESYYDFKDVGNHPTSYLLYPFRRMNSVHPHKYWDVASDEFAGRATADSSAGFSYFGTAFRSVWAMVEVPRLLKKGVREIQVMWYNDIPATNAEIWKGVFGAVPTSAGDVNVEEKIATQTQNSLVAEWTFIKPDTLASIFPSPIEMNTANFQAGHDYWDLADGNVNGATFKPSPVQENYKLDHGRFKLIQFATRAKAAYDKACGEKSSCSFSVHDSTYGKVCLRSRLGIPTGGTLTGGQAIIVVLINLGYSVYDVLGTQSGLYDRLVKSLTDCLKEVSPTTCVQVLTTMIDDIDTNSPLSRAIDHAGSKFNPWFYTGVLHGGLRYATADAEVASDCRRTHAVVYRSMESHTLVGVLGHYLQFIFAAQSSDIVENSPSSINPNMDGTYCPAAEQQSIDPFENICKSCRSYYDWDHSENQPGSYSRYLFRKMNADNAYAFWSYAKESFAARTRLGSKAGMSFVGSAELDKPWNNEVVTRLLQDEIISMEVWWHNKILETAASIPAADRYWYGLFGTIPKVAYTSTNIYALLQAQKRIVFKFIDPKSKTVLATKNLVKNSFDAAHAYWDDHVTTVDSKQQKFYRYNPLTVKDIYHLQCDAYNFAGWKFLRSFADLRQERSCKTSIVSSSSSQRNRRETAAEKTLRHRDAYASLAVNRYRTACLGETCTFDDSAPNGTLCLLPALGVPPGGRLSSVQVIMTALAGLGYEKDAVMLHEETIRAKIETCLQDAAVVSCQEELVKLLVELDKKSELSTAIAQAGAAGHVWFGSGSSPAGPVTGISYRKCDDTGLFLTLTLTLTLVSSASIASALQLHLVSYEPMPRQ